MTLKKKMLRFLLQYACRWEAHPSNDSTDHIRRDSRGTPDCHGLASRQTTSAARSVMVLTSVICQFLTVFSFGNLVIAGSDGQVMYLGLHQP